MFVIIRCFAYANAIFKQTFILNLLSCFKMMITSAVTVYKYLFCVISTVLFAQLCHKNFVFTLNLMILYNNAVLQVISCKSTPPV